MSFERPDIYEVPWRPAYELYAAGGWMISAAAVAMSAGFTPYPIGLTAISSVACLIPAAIRARQGLKVYERRKRLINGRIEKIPLSQLIEKMNANPDKLWLGKGFIWTAQETQLVADLKRQIVEKVLGPEMSEGGAHWLQGLGKAIDLFEDLAWFEGHTLIAGTTGSGKTTLYKLLIPQLILRGECVIMIDPKGDHDIRKIMRQTYEFMGETENYIEFHPAYPETSARLDPIKTWNRITEPASRIASLMSSDSNLDVFEAVSWKVVNDIVTGMVLVEDRPTLMSLKMAIEEGLDALLEKALRYWFSKYDEHWLEDAKHYIQDTKSSKRNTGELAGLVAFYEQNFKKRHKSKEISGIINQYKHDAQHLQKLIAGLIPVLTRLTAGPLAELLSPSTDPDDPRVLTDLAKVIKNRQGLYVGLDSLSDSVVGSSVAAILLAEAAAVAGDRYNYDPDAKQKPINLFVDEASEVINEPLIQLLNKGRGAGFRIFIATQTVADFEARLGNASKARQVMGNLNNNIILRLKDGDTADYFTEGFGQVPIKKYDVSYRSGIDASVMDDEDTSGAYSEALATEDVDMISSDLIKKLPNLHYFASITGGSVKKVQIPIVVAE